MKRLIILVVVGIGVGLVCACQDITVGYLLTENASYKPDSLMIKSEKSLDVTPPTIEETPTPYYEEYIKLYMNRGMTREKAITTLASMNIYPTTTVEKDAGEDYNREKWGQPWVSTPIEGVEGTAPIMVSVKEVTSTDGDAGKMREVLSVRGNGTLEVPLHHGVPAGRYVISLNFRNEGYSKDVNNCFTIIVK